MSSDAIDIAIAPQLDLENDIQISCERILLRNIALEDLETIVNLAGDYRIVEMMNGSIHYPYSVLEAKGWIMKHLFDNSKSRSISWAIISKKGENLLGSIQLRLSDDRCIGMLSYWIGHPYWNQGYATEAGKGVLQFGFENLQLKQIQAEHSQRNPASGSVLKKLGFRFAITEVKDVNNQLENFDKYVITVYEFIRNDRCL